MFEQLPDIYVDSKKYKPAPLVNVSHIIAIVMKEGKWYKDTEIHLSLSMKELIDAKSNDTFCSTKLKLINDNEVS